MASCHGCKETLDWMCGFSKMLIHSIGPKNLKDLAAIASLGTAIALADPHQLVYARYA